jgi:hypothetical protein
MLLDIILARWWRPVASSKALDLLHQAMRAVAYRRIAMAIKMASFVGVFVDCCLFACCPGSCWDNIKQLVNQCRCPVASGVALDMLIGRCALYCTGGPPWTSKQPTTEEHVDAMINFVIHNNRSLIPCSSHYKLKLRHSNIYYNVISLIVYYWLPPLPMDAVLATIVAGGRALLQLNIKSIKIY